jgi:hypothetical protein
MVPTAKAKCELAVIGGGCPNLNECMLTCQPCYRGVGRITAFCRPGGGGIHSINVFVVLRKEPLAAQKVHQNVPGLLLLYYISIKLVITSNL